MIFKFFGFYNPWFYFFIFLICDCFLSYVPASNPEKYLVFFTGIALPIGRIIFSKIKVRDNEQNIFQLEQFNKSSMPLWLLLCLLLMGLRFWKLTTLFRWPTGDETTTGMIALGLMRHWNWNFFHGFGQTPFLFHWTCYFFYQITKSSKLALWLLPAIISAVLIPMVYLGTKRFCSTSFSIIFAGLMAIGIWPIYLGRVGFPIFLFLWEITVLYFLLNFLKEIKQNSGIYAAIWLGLVTGLGSLTTTCWAAMGGLIVFIIISVSIKKNKFMALTVFLTSTMIALLPFFIASWREGYGRHIEAVGFWNVGIGFHSLIMRFMDYWMLLWGTVNEPVTYCTFGGGFLNPILASLFFLGLIEIGLRFSKIYIILFLSILTICLSAGFLSYSLQTYRILTVLPFLFMAVSLGLSGLLNYFSPIKAVLIVLLIFCSSFTLDFYRLTNVYFRADENPVQFEKTGRSYEKYYAGKILENIHSRYGSGLIYTDLIPSTEDETLSFITYSYNCAWNPLLAGESPRWAALFTNSHYRLFLSKEFPQAQWIPIPSADPQNNVLHVLAIIPITPKTAPIFRSWEETYVFCMNTNIRILDYTNLDSIQSNLNSLIDFYPRVPDNPFLQSFYLGKLIYEFSKEKNLHPHDIQINYDSFKPVLDTALKKSCPDALVFTYVGRFLMEAKKFDEAKKFLKSAIRLDPKNVLAVGFYKKIKQNY